MGPSLRATAGPRAWLRAVRACAWRAWWRDVRLVPSCYGAVTARGHCGASSLVEGRARLRLASLVEGHAPGHASHAWAPQGLRARVAASQHRGPAIAASQARACGACLRWPATHCSVAAAAGACRCTAGVGGCRRAALPAAQGAAAPASLVPARLGPGRVLRSQPMGAQPVGAVRFQPACALSPRVCALSACVRYTEYTIRILERIVYSPPLACACS
jgi:hypothetical protein